MLVTVSVVAVLGLILALLLKFRAIGAGVATVAVLFGFFLASTDASDDINSFVSSAIDAIRSNDPGKEGS